MVDPITLSVSVLALAVSTTTAWLTLFRRGTVSMTQPTIFFFGFDSSPSREARPPPKIYLRTLLFATSKRGRIIESMHVSLTRNESQQNFSFWVYGDDKLVRGSGLFVGEAGIATNHHFVVPKDGNTFEFLAGRYRLNVYARLFGDSVQKLLFSQELDLPPEMADSLSDSDTGVYFDWGPDSSRYFQHVDKRPSLNVGRVLGQDKNPTRQTEIDVLKGDAR